MYIYIYVIWDTQRILPEYEQRLFLACFPISYLCPFSFLSSLPFFAPSTSFPIQSGRA